MSAIFHSNTDSPNVLSISGGSGNTINLYAASVGSSLIKFLISDGSCAAYGSAEANVFAATNAPTFRDCDETIGHLGTRRDCLLKIAATCPYQDRKRWISP